MAANGSYNVTYQFVDDMVGAAKYRNQMTAITPTQAGKLARRAVKLGTPVGIALQAALLAADYIEVPGVGSADPTYKFPMFGDAMLAIGASNYYNQTHWACMDLPTGVCISDHPTIIAQFIADTWYSQCGSNPVGVEYVGRTSGANLAGYTYRWGPWFSHTSPSANPPCEPLGGSSYSTAHTISPRPAASPMPGTDVSSLLTSGTTMTDSQLGQALNTLVSVQQAMQLLQDSLDQGYWNLWDQAADIAQSLSESLDASSPTYDAAVDATTQRAPIEQQTATGGGMSGEWPGFCSWATIVCTLADWVMGESVPPEDPDLPAVQVETYDVITVGGGSYSCPSPTSLGSALGQPLVFSWQTACDFSTAVKPVVLLGSLLAAALVLVGVRQTGGGV